VSFTATTPRIASERVFIVVVYFVIDSARKLLDILSYVLLHKRPEKNNENFHSG